MYTTNFIVCIFIWFVRKRRRNIGIILRKIVESFTRVETGDSDVSSTKYRLTDSHVALLWLRYVKRDNVRV